MTENLLQTVQALQFTDKHQAETLLRGFIRETFALDVTAVELRPLAVSLNSINGFLTLAAGKRLFFKTHTESDNVLAEYYNASLLANAGYPVIRPMYTSTEAGRHLLIYEVINDPSVFDVAWAIENGESDALPALTNTQNQADDLLLQLYLHTLDWQSDEQATSAPIHQLFYHRLAHGRLDRFYGGSAVIDLPDGAHPMTEVRRARWVINGRAYSRSLESIIGFATSLLHPRQGPSIIGHGDAHNGNVFFSQEADSLIYFDPAFAGRHDPLLDLVKPLFHNAFATWMYFPRQTREKLNISLRRESDTWHVEHDYELHLVRTVFFRSKVERVLIPILRELKRRGWLRDDWRSYVKAALFCCPFLTLNLADPAKFPPEISLLGLAMSVEMGAEGRGERSLIDSTLDEVERTLAQDRQAS